MKYARLVKTSLFALTMTSASVMAATQGSLRPTSTGTLNIELDIDPLVRVSNLGDMDLGNYTGTGDLTRNDPFCIYRNGGGNYNITINGSGAANAYLLNDGGINDLPYTVSFNNGGANPMAAATPLIAQAGADTSNVDCSVGGDNVSVDVTVADADMAAAPRGTYKGVLTMIVAPE